MKKIKLAVYNMNDWLCAAGSSRGALLIGICTSELSLSQCLNVKAWKEIFFLRRGGSNGSVFKGTSYTGRDLGLVSRSYRSFQGDRIGLLVSCEYQACSW